MVFEHSERFPLTGLVSLSANITYHVRRTIWVFHRSVTLQYSVSFMIQDPAEGYSVS